MKKLLFSTLVLIVILTQFDDNLSEEATSLIARVETKKTSDAFLYLHGIFAEEGEDPISVGIDVLEEYRNFDINESFTISEHPDSNKLTLPDGDEFCKTQEEGCLEYLFSEDISATDLLRQHSTLVSRSNKFHGFNEYRTLSKPTVSEPVPPYQYITAAERIKVISAISLYKNGNASKSVENLLVQFSTLRKSMELQDNLIGKLVFLSTLSEIIDVLSVIMANAVVNIDVIPNLSKSEKSFYDIAAIEFVMMYYTFSDLDRDPEFFKAGGHIPRWLTRIVYKPNMTINAILPIYERLEYLATLSPSELATRLEETENHSPSSSKLRNYAGNTLMSIPPSFDKYVILFADFEAKIALFNQVHIFNSDLDNLENPYYGPEKPISSDGKLCFSGPFEDEESLRCLTMEI